MKVFLTAAWPWIALGLFVAVAALYMAKKRKNGE